MLCRRLWRVCVDSSSGATLWGDGVTNMAEVCGVEHSLLRAEVGVAGSILGPRAALL